MKKLLLSVAMSAFFFTSTLSAQDILYWDFGARELGAGYKNMLPLEYLNNWGGNSVYGIGPETYGNSVEYLNAHPDWATKWNNTGFHYQVGSKSSDPDGIFMSGGSPWTRPTADLPLLDPNINLSFRPDSNSDRLKSIRPDVTRFDERTLMPDGDAAFASHFPGACEFTTSGTKKPERGFNLYGVNAGDKVVIIGAGILADDDEDGGTTPDVTGAFTFENIDLLGDGQLEEDQGAGSTDESVRVIEFTATSAGTFKLGYKYGKVIFYRIYLVPSGVSFTAPDVAPSSPLVKVVDFGGEMLDSNMYDNVATIDHLNTVLSEGAGAALIGQDLRTNSLDYNLAIDNGSDRNPVGLGDNFRGHNFTNDFWFVHNSVGSDRWRSSNTEAVDYDDNVGGPAEALGLTGRVYINNNGPRDRYFSIRPNVDNQQVTIIFRSENGPSTINIEGVDWSGIATPLVSYPVADSEVKALRVTLPNADVDYQIWDSVGKLSIYRVYWGKVDFPVANASDNLGETLGVNDVASRVSTDVQARGSRIYVSNVTTKTEINIYGITGALIKSLTVTNDMDFDFRSGLYIATVKTAEGQKSVKLLVK